ncbi:GNAT family N-acetyltransferase [soil metagenome]
MHVTIRKASTQDLEYIFSLIKAFAVFQTAPEKVKITLEQMKNEQHLFQCFVAETSENEIVGFASFFFAYYSWYGKALYLDDLYVTDAYRKYGVGKKLLDAVIDLAKNEQCKKVRWQVSKWNEHAISFYTKMGATTDDTEINCDYMLNS